MVANIDWVTWSANFKIHVKIAAVIKSSIFKNTAIVTIIQMW